MYSYGPPTYGRAKAGRPARTYIQQLCEDTGCSPEDLPEAMKDREIVVREGQGYPCYWHDLMMIMMIYIYIYRYIYIYIYIYIFYIYIYIGNKVISILKKTLIFGKKIVSRSYYFSVRIFALIDQSAFTKPFLNFFDNLQTRIFDLPRKC